MKKNHKFFFSLCAFIILNFSNMLNVQCQTDSGDLYRFQDIETRWSSFENLTAAKGQGGNENSGAKGHPCDVLEGGQSVTLLNVEGPGIIRRMWFTIDDRSPEMLRSLKLDIFWDGCSKAAISVPFGDFFGIGLGRKTVFENELFADPEGRSFLCFIKMPFKKSAKMILSNESSKTLKQLFYDINLVKMDKWSADCLYFHCYWHRDTATTVGQDFQILPKITGKGRFLGSNIGVNANPVYKNHWWGEGEVKIYADGDTDLPTLVGTGTEDYIGSAWGQGKFCTRYSGCLVADKEQRQWAFFRYHIPDPIFFRNEIKVTIQQMGGSGKAEVIKLQKEGVPLSVVTIYEDLKIYNLYNPRKTVDLTDKNLPNGWTNYYRSDDVSSAAYFYFDKPESNLPPIQTLKIRTTKL